MRVAIFFEMKVEYDLYPTTLLISSIDSPLTIPLPVDEDLQGRKWKTRFNVYTCFSQNKITPLARVDVLIGKCGFL